MTAPVHYIELHADRGEIAPRLVCTATPDAPCRRRPIDPDAETWTGQDETTPGHDCWATEWVDEAGFSDAVRWGELGVTETIARVPVGVFYDEGVVAEPVALPDSADLLPMTPAGAEADRDVLRAAVVPAIQAVEDESARHGVSAGIGMLSDAATDAVLPLLAARGAPTLHPRDRYRVLGNDDRLWMDSGSPRRGAEADAREYLERVHREGWAIARIVRLWSSDPADVIEEWREVTP